MKSFYAKSIFTVSMLACAIFTDGLAAYGKDSGPSRDLVQYANTLQGTNSEFRFTHGNTFPAVTLPFGMHTWTPQTGVNGNGWKYQYARDSIRAFQQAHQCSSWTNDYMVYSLMPVCGKLEVDQYGRAAKFSHDNETARPNYYSVNFDNGIRAELSPVERGAHLKFTFPKGKRSFVVLDGYTGLSAVCIDPDKRRITGYVANGGAAHKGLKNWFIIEFDRPFISYGTWDGVSQEMHSGRLADEGRRKGAYVEFAKGTTVQVKTCSSYIGPSQAELNLKTGTAKPTNAQYFPIDPSLRSMLANKQNALSERNLAIVVFNELRSRGYQVFTSCKEHPVTFVGIQNQQRHYFQFNFSLLTDAAYQKTVANLHRLPDDGPRTLILAKQGDHQLPDDDQVQTVSLVDWLMTE